MWNLPLSKINSKSSCYDCIIEILLRGYNYDYKLFNLKKFSPTHLIWSDNKPMITRGIANDVFLYEVYGFSAIKIEKPSEGVYECICNRLSKQPIGIFVDAYYCYWTTFFKKTHMKHFILIISYDSKEKSFLCVDIYYSKAGVLKIGVENLDQICQKIYFWHFERDGTNTVINSLCYLKNHIMVPNTYEYEKEKSSFSEIFMSELAEIKTVLESIETSKLLIKLNLISQDKLDFLSGIQYVGSLINISLFNSLYDELKIAANQASYLKNILIKCALSGKFSEAKVADCVSALYNSNFAITCELEKIFKSEKIRRIIEGDL